jgi:Rps23 Pro-64 3,4-dihydroxylase Tpa1-like proline 4-hydroxylase
MTPKQILDSFSETLMRDDRILSPQERALLTNLLHHARITTGDNQATREAVRAVIASAVGETVAQRAFSVLGASIVEKILESGAAEDSVYATTPKDPQTPGVPRRMPEDPQPPSHVPGQPQTPGGPRRLPLEPQTPGISPGQPQTPGHMATPPQTPPGSQPQGPGHSPGQPQTPGGPVRLPLEPQTPGISPGQPQTPGHLVRQQTPATPQAPAQPQTPGGPVRQPLEPQTPGKQPQTPGVYAKASSETGVAVIEQPEILPASCVVLDEFLSPQEVEELTRFTLEHKANFTASEVLSPHAEDGVVNYEHRRSRVLMDLGRYEHLMVERVKSVMPEVLRELNLEPFTIAGVEAQVTASNDGDFFHFHSDNGSDRVACRYLTFVYFFHREPKAFEGGELRIHDSRLQDGLYVSQGSYQTIVPRQNQIVLFPCEMRHEITAVKCPSRAFADSRFTLNGWFRR